MGFHTVAIARGVDKGPLARELGARVYIDTKSQDPAAELQKLGGAQVILATVTNADAMTAVIGGLGPEGKLIIVGAPAEPLSVSALPLIFGRRSISGWPSGTSLDSQETLKFAQQAGVKPRIELFPLDEAQAAYDRMLSGEARFRVVMTTS
jgi:D-arabinose 1-dehydrogenase-like Zn-dependent alcohol dehydrogenase